MEDNKFRIGLKNKLIKVNCELEILELLFCFNKKYECYDIMKKYDMCLKKFKKLDNHVKSNNDDLQ